MTQIDSIGMVQEIESPYCISMVQATGTMFSPLIPSKYEGRYGPKTGFVQIRTRVLLL